MTDRRDKDVSAAGLGVVVAIGSLLMACLSIDGLVSGESVNIGKYRNGVPISGARGIAVALGYGTCALALAIFTIACFNANSGRQGRLMSWAKTVFIASGAILFVSLFFKW